MKRFSRKLVSLLLAGTMAFSLAACGEGASGGDSAAAPAAENGGGEASADLDTSKTVKIGVLVSDATSAEALGRRAYLEEFIQKNFNVEFVYSDELADAAAETSAIDTMIANNCKAILSESSFDRPAQIEQCEAANVYLGVGAGTLSDEEYETYSGYDYYVGAIGPSLDTEFSVGYGMAKHYLDQGMKNFAIFGGAVAYYTDMHIYRVAGMLTAMCEAGGGDYKGASDAGAIIGQIYADGGVDTGAIGDVNLSGYLDGYNLDDAWWGSAAEMANTPGLEAILAVGNGSDFFGSIAPESVKIASVDAIAQDYLDAMEAGSLDYCTAKFSAYDATIFCALYRAALGNKLTTPDGKALALDMGYWTVESADDMKKCLEIDKSYDFYDVSDLTNLLTSDYDTFAAFVADYEY